MSFCPVAVTSLVCPPRPATAVCESGLFEERTNAPEQNENGNVNADRTTAEQAHTHMSQRLHLRKPSVVDFLIPRARGETTSTTALTGHCACHGACATALHTPAEHFSLPPWAVWCVPALRVPLVHSLILTVGSHSRTVGRWFILVPFGWFIGYPILVNAKPLSTKRLTFWRKWFIRE